MPVGLIKLKLGSCVNMPTRRYRKLMDQASLEQSRVSNAVLRGWQRWREDNPDWEPGPARDRQGQVKINQKGETRSEPEHISQEVTASLYHVYKKVAPTLSSNVASGGWTQALKLLTHEMPWNHPGEAKYRWQAIMLSEVNLPTFGPGILHCPHKNSVLTYSDDAFTIKHPLLNRSSGYRVINPIVRLKGFRSHGISRGHQRILRKIVEGEYKRSDSNFVLKDGAWYYHMSYKFDSPDAAGLDPEKTVFLHAVRNSQRRPFEMTIEGDDRRPWGVGDGRAFEYAYRRIVAKDQGLRYTHRKKGDRKGHGRRQFDATRRRYARQSRHSQTRFLHHLVADIVKYCLRNQAGTLHYHEPTMPLRKHLWMDQQGLPFNWTAFWSDLKNKCDTIGIAIVEVKRGKNKFAPRIGVAAHKEAFPNQWKKDESESVTT